MENPGQEANGSSSWIRRILIIVFLCLMGLPVIVIVGGMLVAGYLDFEVQSEQREEGGAHRRVKEFLDEVQANHVEAAYRQTTSSFQARQSLDDLQHFLNQYPVFKESADRALLPATAWNDGRRVPVYLGHSSFIILVKKENEDWKVDSIEPYMQ